MFRPIRKTTSLVGALLLATACVGGEPEVGSIDRALQSENALSLNALSLNALSLNALSLNALSLNALSLNGLDEELDLGVDNPLIETAEGRHVLKYVVRCAMPANVTVVGEDANASVYTFPGLLGLAPEWDEEELSATAAGAISACMLAHVNYFGVSIAISARHPELAVSQEELDRFTTFEGAFFGDLFSPTNVKYTCTGDSAPDFSVSYPNHDATAGDRLLRRCTDVDGSDTACGFVNVGACSTACTVNADGAASSCSGGGTTYNNVMTIWLLAHDDVASTLDDVYDAYYGP